MGVVKTKNSERTKKLVTLAVLVAMIIVLGLISNFSGEFLPVSFTLALAPIVIGAALYGMWTGAFLGAVLGVVNLISGIAGLDKGFVLLLMDFNPVFTVILCILKTTLAGLAAGALYGAISKKNDLAATFAAGAACPVVNTGLFLLGMFTVLIDALKSLAGGAALFTYAITAFVGINFAVEFPLNMVLAVAITRIIRIVKK